MLMMLTVMLIGMSACGGTKFNDTGVRPGTYAVSVQGVSGNVVHSAQLQLTIR
jgi:hypothetical protein